jgi:hypothetical protein
MSQPQMNRLRPDIVLIGYSDPRAKEIHISTNTYALLKAGRMLLEVRSENNSDEDNFTWSGFNSL